MPSVVKLRRYIRRRRIRVALSRRNIFFRDNHQCQYCGRKEPSHISTPFLIPVHQPRPSILAANCLDGVFQRIKKAGPVLFCEGRRVVFDFTRFPQMDF